MSEQGGDAVTFSIGLDTSSFDQKLDAATDKLKAKVSEVNKEMAAAPKGTAVPISSLGNAADTAGGQAEKSVPKWKALWTSFTTGGNNAKGLSATLRNVTQGVAQFTGQFGGMAKLLGAAGIGAAAAYGISAVSAGIRDAIGGFKELAAQGQRFDDIMRGFSTLSLRKGIDPTEMLEGMRRATQGLVADMKLMETANEAIILGLPVTAKGMETITEKALLLGRTMGVDVDYALKSIVLGIGRQSRLWLDNIGIIVKAEPAYDALAKTLGKTRDQLTLMEQKTAFYNAAMEAMDKGSVGLTLQTQTLTMSLNKVGVGWDNVTQKTGMLVNRLLSFPTAASTVGNALSSLGNTLQDLAPAARTMGNVLDFLVTKMVFGDAIQGLQELTDVFSAAHKVFKASPAIMESVAVQLDVLAKGLGKVPGAGGPLLRFLSSLASAAHKAGEEIKVAVDPNIQQTDYRELIGVKTPTDILGDINNIQAAINATRDMLAPGYETSGFYSVLTKQLEDLEKRLASAKGAAGLLGTALEFMPKDTPQELNRQFEAMTATMEEMKRLMKEQPQFARAWAVAVENLRGKINDTKVALGELPKEWRENEHAARLAAEMMALASKHFRSLKMDIPPAGQALRDFVEKNGGTADTFEGLQGQVRSLNIVLEQNYQRTQDGTQSAGEYYRVLNLVGQALTDLQKKSPLELPGVSKEGKKAVDFANGPADIKPDPNAPRLSPDVEPFLEASAAVRGLTSSYKELQSITDPGVRSSEVYRLALKGVSDAMFDVVKAGGSFGAEIDKQVQEIHQGISASFSGSSSAVQELASSFDALQGITDPAVLSSNMYREALDSVSESMYKVIESGGSFGAVVDAQIEQLHQAATATSSFTDTSQAIRNLTASYEVLTGVTDPAIRSTQMYQDALGSIASAMYDVIQSGGSFGAAIDDQVIKLHDATATANLYAEAMQRAAGGPEFMATMQLTGGALSNVQMAYSGIYSVVDSVGKIVAKSGDGHAAAAKKIAKIQARMLQIRGIISIAEGVVLIAKSVYPTVPQGIAGGILQIAAGAAAISQAKSIGADGGGGGGSAAAGAGGGGAPTDYSQAIKTPGDNTGTTPVIAGAHVKTPEEIRAEQEAAMRSNVMNVTIQALDSKSFHAYMSEPANRKVVSDAVNVHTSRT